LFKVFIREIGPPVELNPTLKVGLYNKEMSDEMIKKVTGAFLTCI